MVKQLNISLLRICFRTIRGFKKSTFLPCRQPQWLQGKKPTTLSINGDPPKNMYTAMLGYKEHLASQIVVVIRCPLSY